MSYIIIVVVVVLSISVYDIYKMLSRGEKELLKRLEEQDKHLASMQDEIENIKEKMGIEE